jgi:hypothetical protein
MAGEMIALGSFLKNPPRANDIELIVVEFTDERLYSVQVRLEPYWRIARLYGRSGDLFFGTREVDFNLADPATERWCFA